ncbi:hypothetical protein HMPREF1991_02292 [Hoylesella loescheii DSM 19665 = JCM 12249 = ATCC 15930]|uniref:Uncharacterized protein n=1 Tax=Hoylesella loescheii DSM 19665 = JCM 12249 = ATCC 15930 TaxID=1122985 RepID=A0A069QGB1_HOYLO|nr:hypothetical protein HMPREF1991_02292 [Hoylesella loescheii DSM 19665 = JCM 12249 = ATCC 15930]
MVEQPSKPCFVRVAPFPFPFMQYHERRFSQLLIPLNVPQSVRKT